MLDHNLPRPGRIHIAGISLALLLLPAIAHPARALDIASSYPAIAGYGNVVGGEPRSQSAHDAVEPRLSIFPPSPRLGPPSAPLHVATSFSVTTVNDTGAGSLRKAITSANASPGLDIITFAIPGSGVQTINLNSPLPTITDPVTIDGTTQGPPGAPLVMINGSSAGANASGLNITAGGSTVRGLIISGFHGSGGTNGIGIVVDVNGGNVITGNYVGTNAAGTAPLANAGAGIAIFGTSSGNTIGGLTPLARNVISGNSISGVQVSPGNAGGNRVIGNYIGVNATGTAIVANGGNGVYLDAPNDTVGGSVAGARNIISGNAYPGIGLDAAAVGTVIRGNFIGTDAAGTIDLGNVQNGIVINGAPGTIIGDTTVVGRNVIGANGYPQIYVLGAAASGTIIVGNYLGTDSTGTKGLGHGNGVVLDGATNTTIGGVSVKARNILSGDPFPGIFMTNGATGNKVIGNFIGLNPSGTAAVPNSKGITINESPRNTIGGMTAAERNVISGNDGYGIDIRGAGSIGNRVMGNFIGTDTLGTGPMGNGLHGVVLNAPQDSVGGTSVAAGNVIAFNHGVGVYDSSGTGGFIRFNSIFKNTATGIDLFPRGVTPNDSLDGDSGANDLQNFPLLDSALVVAGTTTIYGRLDSQPFRPYTIDVFVNDSCNASHFGEGRTLLTSLVVRCDATGRAPIAAPVASVIPTTKFFTATATDSLGSTSEFSQCLCMSDADGDGILDTWETSGWGIDVNSDGKIDLDLYALGARPNHKDLFVEIDAMSGYVPPDTSLRMVVASFATAAPIFNPDGQPGIALHYTLDDTTIAVKDFPNIWTDFDLVKAANFGTQTQRTDPNARYILQAKRLVYRYGLWARTFGTHKDDTLASGLADVTLGVGGNDFMVTFGSTGTKGWNSTKDVRNHAGTFMHEFGHTLGLRHGGNNDDQYKPNYYSVMNYAFQVPTWYQSTGSWVLNYSPYALPTLNETSLNESVGLNPPPGAYPIITVPFTDSLRQLKYARLQVGTPVDWTGNGTATSAAAMVDLNLVGEESTVHNPGQSLTGYADWPNLAYNFRKSPSYKPTPSLRAVEVTAVPSGELTRQIYDRLYNRPAPKPSGTFIMDGLLDPGAKLLASNAGVNLYGAYKNGQLYVATNSAQSQGADMFIFVSDTPGALSSAPLGKAGQVGAWGAYLFNAQSDNSSTWSDATEATMNSMTVDTAGAVLEGVVDAELLYGRTLSSLSIAVGKYHTGAAGALLAQVPAGNLDGNIDPSEWYTFAPTTDVPRTPGITGGRVALSPARPNPVTGQARVHLSLAEAGHVQATVHDVTGRTVAVIANGKFTAGEHDLVWNPVLVGGRRQPAGVYFLVVKALGETHSARVVLIR